MFCANVFFAQTYSAGVRFLAKQFTIIDGYNFLHVNGFIDGQKVGPGTLEKARNLLTGMLRKSMDISSRQRTTVVFDSKEPNLPNRATVHEVLVEFANQHESADELIAILIAKHSAPKQLSVVSSDHQIQQRAIARGATAIDSDKWLDELDLMSASVFGKKSESGDSVSGDLNSHPDSEKPTGSSAADNAFWKSEFANDESRAGTSITPKPKKEFPPGNSTHAPSDLFPEGYADDLFDDDSPE